MHVRERRARLVWLRRLALDGRLAVAEPKTLRYRILNAATPLTCSGRRRRLRIQATAHRTEDPLTNIGVVDVARDALRRENRVGCPPKPVMLGAAEPA